MRGSDAAVVDRFVSACVKNVVDTVSQLIVGGIDINGMTSTPRGPSWPGFTGLMMAIYYNNVAIVRMLLASESVNLAMRDSSSFGGGFGGTALHWGCRGGSVESVGLFLAHLQCTKDIVKMENVNGDTAEMLVKRSTSLRVQECCRLVREFLDANVNTAVAASGSPTQELALSLGQLEKALAIVEREEAARKRRKEVLTKALAKEEREEAELKSRKDALTATLMGGAMSQSSIVPECPVCLVKMAPPLQIFNCSNGHLICNLCKPRIPGNLCVTRCQSRYTGRATAVEQIVRNTLSIE